MGSKLAKTFRTALSSYLVRHSSFWAWHKNENIFRSEWDQNLLNFQNGSLKPIGASQLILSSKLGKTFRMALSTHLVHHSSFWAWEKMKTLIHSECDQNLLKRSVWLSEAIWCITAHFELEQKWKIVSLRMGSKLAKTFRMALSSHLVHHSSFWAQNLLKRSEWLSQAI